MRQRQAGFAIMLERDTPDEVRIAMYWPKRLNTEFNNWRADRQIFNGTDAVRMMIRWAAAHDFTGRQRPVQPTDPILVQLDAFMDANVLLNRTEAVKLAILTVLRQPWPTGNARPEQKKRQPKVRPSGPPRLVLVKTDAE